jgi:hypothetical protein
MYLRRLQPLLNVPLSLPELCAESDVEVAVSPPPGAAPLPGVLDQLVAVAGAEPQQAAALLANGAVERYLVDGVLANHRRALQLHAELQSAASLPLDRQAAANGSAAVAWETLVTQRNFVTTLLAQVHAKYQGASEELSEARARLDDARTTRARENQHLSGELRQLQKALEAEKAKATQYREDRAKASVEYDGKLQELRAENELLLTQLHHVQEELEKIYLRKQELEERYAKNAARNKAAAERAKQRIRSLIQRLKNAKELIKSEGAHEAERVRQHISYRLGQVVLRHGKTPSGWLILPFALMREAREYRRQGQWTSGSPRAK